MCGINGFSFKDERLISEMNCSLGHRGPDGLSGFTDDDVSLGHARLSIIDLSDAASQPMNYSFKGRNLTIVFNGEIYNYIELRERLIQLGYPFKTVSDTEVIMAAYLEWGEQAPNHFNGMWSLCLYDRDQKKFFCSRDRLGVKPFYYYFQEGKFIFSSELKSIVKHSRLRINSIENTSTEALEFYFSMGYIPAPLTIYRNVYKLEAGHNLIYDLQAKRLESKYAYYVFPVHPASSAKNELIEEGRVLLHDAVKLRMRSDVPVGAFLSGGLDSSTVVGEMKHFTDITKLHTFSIGFEEKKYDESNYINLVKDYFHSVHHHHIYTEKDFQDTWPLYADIFDEPFGDYSSFPSYTVCKMARREVTVVLSGDGGDEIFGGYPIYSTGYLLEKLHKLPVFSRKMLLKLSSGFGRNPLAAKVNEVMRLSTIERKDFYGEMFSSSRYKPEIYREWASAKLGQALEFAENNLSEALRIYDLLSNTLPDNFLVKVDRTSMANSIEVRSPFLDFRFVEYAQKIPSALKVGFVKNKILMREIIRGIVPREIVERDKMGFTPPIHTWLDRAVSSEQFDTYLDYLAAFNIDASVFYTNLLREGKKNFMSDMYRMRLTIFGKWFEKWILNEGNDRKAI